jgi:hypothetical protein
MARYTFPKPVEGDGRAGAVEVAAARRGANGRQSKARGCSVALAADLVVNQECHRDSSWGRDYGVCAWTEAVVDMVVG